MGGHRGNAEVNIVVGWGDPRGATQCPCLNQDHCTISSMLINTGGMCQVRVYSGRGSGQVWTKADEGQGQEAGQEVSPAGVGDRLDSTTEDNKR